MKKQTIVTEEEVLRAQSRLRELLDAVDLDGVTVEGSRPEGSADPGGPGFPPEDARYIDYQVYRSGHRCVVAVAVRTADPWIVLDDDCQRPSAPADDLRARLLGLSDRAGRACWVIGRALRELPPTEAAQLERILRAEIEARR